MQCNGCGREFDTLAGTFSYGDVSMPCLPERATQQMVPADHHKTLCPRCQHVLKDILMSSDLSDHWEKYEWSLMGDAYTEEYDT